VKCESSFTGDSPLTDGTSIRHVWKSATQCPTTNRSTAVVLLWFVGCWALWCGSIHSLGCCYSPTTASEL